MRNKKQVSFQTGDYVVIDKNVIIEELTRDLGEDDENLPHLIKSIQDQEYFLVTSKSDEHKACLLYHPELNLAAKYTCVLEVVGTYPGVEEARKVNPKDLVDASYEANTVVQLDIPMMLAHEDFGSGVRGQMVSYALYQIDQGVAPSVQIYRKLTEEDVPESHRGVPEVMKVLGQGGPVYHTLDGLGAYQSWMFVQVLDKPFNHTLARLQLFKDAMELE